MMNVSLLRRFGAILYDTLLILALLFLSALPFIAARGGEPVESGNTVFQVTLVAVVYLFFVIFWSRYGRTLGMQSWGLRLETADGDPPGLKLASLRFVAAIVSWLPCGLGFFWQLLDAENLTWHDRLSKTRVRYYPKTDE
ncbi:MAG: RDD family protein [Woeseia sp.]|nr:RDD family protein [Woeseia sp.]NNL54520.1 RDD family protein [Woeseia sp.]